MRGETEAELWCMRGGGEKQRERERGRERAVECSDAQREGGGGICGGL